MTKLEKLYAKRDSLMKDVPAMENKLKSIKSELAKVNRDIEKTEAECSAKFPKSKENQNPALTMKDNFYTVSFFCIYAKNLALL